MSLNTLNDLFVNEINELHAAELHSAEIIREIARSATSPLLAEHLSHAATIHDQHLQRMRDVFAKLGLTPRPTQRAETEGMRGLCEDCMRLITASRCEPHVRDAAIVGVVQHLLHDQLAGYGCARTWSGLLGHEKVPSLLQANLREERELDVELTHLADNLNRSAMAHVLP